MTLSLFLTLAATSAVWLSGLVPSGHAATEDAVANAVKDPGLYAIFDTSMGTVVCKLHYDKAPATVGNFVGLALGEKEWRDPKTSKLVTRPLYDGLIFHRCIKNFMIQGGCPLGTGMAGPGYSFDDEFHPDLKHDKPGVLSMANSGPGTNGSQFFITHKETPWLDGRHTVFGYVTAGQEVVNAIAQGDRIESIRIERVGDKAKAFDATQVLAANAGMFKAR